MDYKYDVVNYNKNIPATVMRLNLSSDTHKTELQWHREPEIVFVIEGKSECCRNGESRIVDQDDFIIFNSEDVHLVRPVDGTSCSLLCVNFSFEYIRMFSKSIDSMLFDDGDNPAVHAEIIDVLRQIASVDINSDYSPLIQISYINKLYYVLLTKCVHFKRLSGNPASPRRDFSYAKTAIAYINENFKHEISLDEISGVVNLSPSYFSKYFKNVTQVSFSEYLANLRLENAINDMLSYNTTVSTAAFENGFANVKSFITQCKKIYNCTPAQYKKRLLSRKRDKLEA